MRKHIITIGLVIAVGLVLGGAGARMPSMVAGQATPEAEEPGFIGAWLVSFVIDGRPTATNLTSFTTDGTMLTANLPSMQPGADQTTDVILHSAGHGSWVATSDHAIDITFIILQSDLNGNSLGTRTIRGTLELDSSGDVWRGTYTATVADPGGEVMHVSDGNVQATRIMVEPMDDGGTPVAATPVS